MTVFSVHGHWNNNAEQSHHYTNHFQTAKKKKKTQMLQMFIKLFQYTDVAFLCQSVHTACLVKITFKHEFFLYRDLLNGQINQINPLTCIPSLLQCPLLVQSGLSVFILYKKKTTYGQILSRRPIYEHPLKIWQQRRRDSEECNTDFNI